MPIVFFRGLQEQQNLVHFYLVERENTDIQWPLTWQFFHNCIRQKTNWK